MRPFNAVAGLVAATLVTACVINTGQRTDPTANQPQGTRALLFIDRGPRISGELLEMRDTAYVILTEREIVLVPFRIVENARFTQQPLWFYGSRPSPEVHRQLRLRSRFPQGMSPEILAKLLALTGQTSLTVASQS